MVMQLRKTHAFLLIALGLSIAGIGNLSAQEGQLLHEKVHSPALEGNILGDSPDRDVYIYLPPSYDRESDRRYPVLFLLHGYCSTCADRMYVWWVQDSWAGNVPQILESLIAAGKADEMILVIPDTDNAYRGTWYENSATTGNWRDFIARDLVEYVDSTYRTLADREHRGIAGHSMGGNGAFRVAFNHPNVFGAVYGMAGGPMGLTREEQGEYSESWWAIMALGESATFKDVPQDSHGAVTLSAAFAPNPDNPPLFIDPLFEEVDGELQMIESVWQRWLARDPVVMAKTLRDKVEQLYAIYVDCGIYDGLIEGSRRLDQALNEVGIEHVYEEFPGDHLSDVARIMSHRVLPFFSKMFSGELPRLRSGTGNLETRLAGETRALRIALTLDGPVPLTGQYPDLVLDLSAIELEEVAMDHDGAGRYAFTQLAVQLPNGNYSLPVRLAGTEPGSLPLFIARLRVVPGEDMVVIGEDMASEWQIENSGGAEVPVAAADGPVFAGEAAMAFRVESASFLGWKVNLVPPQPVRPFGYTHLHFAFHPGNAAGKALNLNLGKTGGVKLISPRGESMVDLEKKDWQVVELDLQKIGVIEPFEMINLNGTLEGTFYIDDMRLVAEDVPVTTAVLEEQTAAQPRGFLLAQNYPNPFNSGTVIRFVLPESQEVELSIHNLAGQKVATLVEGARPAGSYSLNWDGRDDEGRALASSVYLYRLRTGGDRQVETRKLVLVR